MPSVWYSTNLTVYTVSISCFTNLHPLPLVMPPGTTEKSLVLSSLLLLSGTLCKLHSDSSDKVLTARSQEDTLGKRYLYTCPISVILFLNTSVCSLCQRWKSEERISVQWQFFYNSVCKLLWEIKILQHYRKLRPLR